MTEKARIFQNGGSQAVRLPKSCRFPEDQEVVVVRRHGRKVILEPADEWPQGFLDCLGAWQDEIPRPRSTKIGDRRVPGE